MVPPEEVPSRPAERWVLWDGIASRVMDTWTGGVVLAGLAVLLDASNIELGIIAALPMLAQVAQLPAVYLLRLVRDRKRIVLVCSFGARLLIAVLAILLLAGRLDSGRLVFVMFASGMLTVVSTAAWNTWMHEVLDSSRFGSFFAKRMQFATAVAAGALLLAGWYLGETGAQPLTERYAFVILAGSAAGLVSFGILWATPPPMMGQQEARRGALMEVFRSYSTPGGPRIVAGLGLTATALSLALPFSAVYLIRSADRPFLEVTIFALGSLLAYMVGLRVWGRVSDQHGNRGVMQIALLLLAGTLVLWSIQWQGHTSMTILLAVVHIASGLAIGGLELTSGNLLLKMAPRGRVPTYLAAFSLARAGISAGATLAAGILWEAMGRGTFLSWTWFGVVFEFRGFHVLTLASAVVAMLAYRTLAAIPEPKAGPVPDVAKAVRREVQAMSSVAGLRGFGHAASFLGSALRLRPRDPGKP